MTHGERLNHYENFTDQTLKDFHTVFTYDRIPVDMPETTKVEIGEIINTGDYIMREIFLDGKSKRFLFNRLRGGSPQIARSIYDIIDIETGDIVETFTTQADVATFLGISAPWVRQYANEQRIMLGKYRIKFTEKERQKIILFDMAGHALRKFDNIKEAAQYRGCTVGYIRQHVKSKKFFRDKGYMRYENEL
jgi:predicted transcriptional regulator